MLALFDAVSGRPLALMDSIAITTLRTAAATAVAARYLAPAEAESLLLVGCGNQARAHLTALLAVRPVARVFAYDVDSAIAAGFATEMCELHQLSVSAVSDLHAAALSSEMIVTCTPATKAFLEVEDVQQGAFVAAVGADNEHKHEITSALMAAACVVVDDLEQCAAIGDLHHAIKDGAMRQDHVRAELGDVVCDPASGRRASTEIVVFDSTGVAIEDVAAAATVYERAVAEGGGQEISLLD